MSLAETAPPAPRPAAPLMIAGALFALLALTPLLSELYGGAYITSLAIRAMILAIVAISLDLLMGHAGLVSFGHSAFVAIGAYTAGIMVTEGTYEMTVILPTGHPRRRRVRRDQRGDLPAHLGRLLHHDHARLRADGVLRPRLAGAVWRR